MKKYFIAETDDELRFGDTIEVNLTKEEEDGSTVHKCMKCKFIPELVDLLLEEGVIEVQEEEDEDKIEFDDTEDCFDELFEALEELEKRVEALEEAQKENKTTKPCKEKKK